jgi:formate hydrogenlyase transcriptional activator
LLVSHYARQIGERLGKSISEVPAQVVREFTRYDWPGNIRELQNVIERAVIVSSDGVLRLPEPLVQATTAPAGEGEAFKEPMTISTLDEAERDHILRALEATGWRIEGPKGAAAMLKLHPSTKIPHEKARPDQDFEPYAAIPQIKFTLTAEDWNTGVME